MNIYYIKLTKPEGGHTYFCMEAKSPYQALLSACRRTTERTMFPYMPVRVKVLPS